MAWIISEGNEKSDMQGILVMIWAWFYGCALHSAGFAVSRGIRILGWIFAAIGSAVGLGCRDVPPHLLMGGLFGGLHLAAGIYLYLTEKRGNES